MLLAIQEAYYLHAQNPSDTGVLIKLAEDIGLDCETFSVDLNSKCCKDQLKNELQLSRELGVNSFPSLVLLRNHVRTNIPVDYKNSKNILCSIRNHLAGDG